MFVGDVAVVPGGRELPSRRHGNYLETAPFAEASFCSVISPGL
jgi:hypothetical protein